MPLESTDIFRSQTSMLQWLRRHGHQVDFSPDGSVTGQIYADSAPAYRSNGKRCPYCHNLMVVGTRRFPTRDHVRPRRAGGTLAPWNCLVVCAPCNVDKGDKMLSEFVAWLEKRNDPRRDIVKSINPDTGLIDVPVKRIA